MTYLTEWDEEGGEVITLVGGDYPLPPNYYQREAALAAENIVSGHWRRHMAVSDVVWHLGVQRVRECIWPPWGEKFAKRDPRQFGSMPRAKRCEP